MVDSGLSGCRLSPIVPGFCEPTHNFTDTAAIQIELKMQANFWWQKWSFCPLTLQFHLFVCIRSVCICIYCTLWSRSKQIPLLPENLNKSVEKKKMFGLYRSNSPIQKHNTSTTPYRNGKVFFNFFKFGMTVIYDADLEHMLAFIKVFLFLSRKLSWNHTKQCYLQFLDTCAILVIGANLDISGNANDYANCHPPSL